MASVVIGVPSAAHPRSRGENVAIKATGTKCRGSSPLTRGKPESGALRQSPGRLIPAHAGKTRDARVRAGKTQAHPRSRGENEYLKRGSFISPGSSPLTRGKPRRALRNRNRTGLIPAHAGKTAPAAASSCTSPAHPRSRGENFQGWGHRGGDRGSSPLTRGKPPGTNFFMVGVRLIPAHAGKTRLRRPTGRSCPAHPRSRGENSMVAGAASAAAGSSPLTRGKRRRGSARAGRDGLIPAHAGKTHRRSARNGIAGAHPRSRGENNCESLIVSWVGGSSPLTRGKPGRGRRPIHRVRLIPAHAGKTEVARPLLC